MDVLTYKEFLPLTKKVATNDNVILDKAVLDIIQQVRQDGDKAIFKYTEKFDRVSLKQLKVTEDEFLEAEKFVSEEFRAALKVATENITTFHQSQVEKSWFLNKPNGVMLGQQVTPIDRVGVYIPGGKATYPSTVLMNLIPAKIAGVKEIFVTSPPQEDGKLNPHILVAAGSLGIHDIYKMGGAHAIAALAYGTESVKKVDKIVGPGNAYVARAKKWVFGDVAIDMIAGPSEICVVADETARADFVAADLLSQAEHDEDAVPLCITMSQKQAGAIAKEIERQVGLLERQKIARSSLQTNGKIIVVDTLDEAFQLVNIIAPEHLQLMIKNATDYLSEIRHAGAIFLGSYSPEALGDYVAGPNHTLPTNGTAKFSSPLGVYDFIKRSSIIRYSDVALLEESAYIETLAETEDLSGHAKAIAIRRG